MTEPAVDMQWQRLEDMPVGKWEPASLVHDSKLYVLGGYADNIISSRRQDVFDPKERNWTQLQDCPSTISHVNLVPDDNGFWYAGGMKDKPGKEVKDHIIAEFWHYNICRDRFSAAPLLPEPRAAGALQRIGNRLHYISGLMVDRDTDSPDHFVFDLEEWALSGKGQWMKAAPLEVPRNQHSIATMQGKIYVIGGQFNHDSQQLDQDRVDIYDPDLDSWSEGPPLPVPHSHSEHATVVHEDRIWMIGGHSTPVGGKKGFCPNIVTLAAGADWQLTGLLPKPISSPAAGIIDKKLYVAGGWDGRMDESRNWLSSPEVWCTDVAGV